MSATKIKHAPVLRFPEFTEPWQEKRGRELFGSRRLRGKNGLPIYSVTLTNGLVPRDSLNRQFGADAEIESHLRAKPGDLVYNMMRMWQGAVGRADVECMVSPAYVVLTPKSDVDSKYFTYNLQRTRSIYNLWAYSYGLTSDRLRLYYRDFGHIKFHIPLLTEQKKISTVLSTVDKKLATLRRKCDLLHTYKRGLMQRFFSRELRFTAKDGSSFSDWEEILASKLFTNHSNKTHDGNLPILAITQESGAVLRDHVDKIILSSKESVNSYKVVDKGDFIISLRSFQGGIEYSKVYGICSPAYTILKPIRPIHDDFYRHYFKNPDFIKRLSATTVGIREGKQVSYSAFGNLKLIYPSIEEQQKIANFFSAIDAKIDAVAEQIDKMKQFKKGLLQQMFV
jgi:type I restriction enzyme S subunit